jgi:thiol-disulfide isomerase/thioredoxin
MSVSGIIINQGATQLLDSIDQAAKHGQHLVVLMFAGEQCPPCKQLAPKLNNLLKTKYSNVICLKFMAEQDRLLSEDEKVFPLYGIARFPTILFVKKGHLVGDEVFRLVNPSITQVENAIKQLTTF